MYHPRVDGVLSRGFIYFEFLKNFDDKVFSYINIEGWFFEISVLKEWHVSCVLFYCEDTAEVVW